MKLWQVTLKNQTHIIGPIYKKYTYKYFRQVKMYVFTFALIILIQIKQACVHSFIFNNVQLTVPPTHTHTPVVFPDPDVKSVGVGTGEEMYYLA